MTTITRFMYRLIRAGGKLLIWGMDTQTMGFGLTVEQVRQIFGSDFDLENVEKSQFHQRASKWYWLERNQ